MPHGRPDRVIVPQREWSRLGHPDPAAWRLRARRRCGAGCLRGGACAVAERRHPCQSTRLAGECRPPQGYRPAAAAYAFPCQARADRGRSHVRSANGGMVPRRFGGGQRRPGRRPASDIHLLPPGFARGGADRADVAYDLWIDDKRDRQGVSGIRKNHGAAAGARQSKNPRRRDPLSGAVARRDCRSPRWRVGGDLSDLHGRLCRNVRPEPDPRRIMPGSNPALPPSDRCHAGSGGSQRAAGADAPDRRAA